MKGGVSLYSAYFFAHSINATLLQTFIFTVNYYSLHLVKQNTNTMRTELTFTQAATTILDDGNPIIFTADNNRNPEQPGFEFQITTFEHLCEEYKLLYKDYCNIKLYAVS